MSITRQEKVLALSIDYDGCLAGGNVDANECLIKPLYEESNNKEFLKSLVSIIKKEGYNRVIILDGSSRQSTEIDDSNARRNKNGSCFDKYPQIKDVISEALKDDFPNAVIEFDDLLLADILDRLKSGTHYRKHLAGNGLVDSRCIVEHEKVLLVRAQMQHIANKYKNADYLLCDDKQEEILKKLLVIHKKYPDFFPGNVRFGAIHHYAYASDVKSLPKLQNGSGQVDEDYFDNTLWLIELAGIPLSCCGTTCSQLHMADVIDNVILEFKEILQLHQQYPEDYMLFKKLKLIHEDYEMIMSGCKLPEEDTALSTVIDTIYEEFQAILIQLNKSFKMSHPLLRRLLDSSFKYSAPRILNPCPTVELWSKNDLIHYEAILRINNRTNNFQNPMATKDSDFHDFVAHWLNLSEEFRNDEYIQKQFKKTRIAHAQKKEDAIHFCVIRNIVITYDNLQIKNDPELAKKLAYSYSELGRSLRSNLASLPYDQLIVIDNCKAFTQLMSIREDYISKFYKKDFYNLTSHELEELSEMHEHYSLLRNKLFFEGKHYQSFFDKSDDKRWFGDNVELDSDLEMVNLYCIDMATYRFFSKLHQVEMRYVESSNKDNAKFVKQFKEGFKDYIKKILTTSPSDVALVNLLTLINNSLLLKKNLGFVYKFRSFNTEDAKKLVEKYKGKKLTQVKGEKINILGSSAMDLSFSDSNASVYMTRKR